MDERTRKRARPGRSPKNIAAVTESVREQPSTLTRHGSQQLGILHTFPMRILRKDIAWKAYRAF